MKDSVLNIIEFECAQFPDTNSRLELEHHCQRSQSVHKPFAVLEVVPDFPKDEDLFFFSIYLRAVLLLLHLAEHPLAVDLHLAEQVLLHYLKLFGIIEHLSDYERHIVVHDLRHIILAYHLVYPLIEFDFSDFSDPFIDDRNSIRIVLIILLPV